jgi:hypothetical protein
VHVRVEVLPDVGHSCRRSGGRGPTPVRLSWVRFLDCNWFEMRGLGGKFGFGLTFRFLAFVPPFFVALHGGVPCRAY